MPKIEIYTKATCPYCDDAIALLQEKDVTYIQIPIDNDSALREKMITRSDGRHTVPQIFIDNDGIGGCDDLYALDTTGELDRLLK